MAKANADKFLSPQDAVFYIKTPPAVKRLTDYMDKNLKNKVCVGARLLSKQSGISYKSVKEVIRHFAFEKYKFDVSYNTVVYGNPNAIAEFKKEWNKNK